ncbi:cytoskeleton protein RodZ [Vibrio sp. CK2-1]|uniref:cytoskeleton protein RodZ n=1 Tax=Vibrio sp. CK2-1 TaxID=2912249 RepID=UPI001F008E18|nr:cytoskeleton protein RodZ [Vibrio sp. CK2-1]MCF7355581.1 cytoskeleton protein RodZ [Vibrio sp. CK2-1]
MSTENNELETKSDNHKILPGEMLRQRREELGLTQKDISERLRLKISVIENIESNHFDSHHVATFIRGYFRSYAKAVGIKEKDILAALEESGRGQHKEQPMHSFSQKTKKQQHDNRIMRLTWGILVIIIGISSVWWWQNHQLDTLSPSSLSSQQESAVIESEQVEDAPQTFVSEEPTSEEETIAEFSTPSEQDSTATDDNQPEVVTQSEALETEQASSDENAVESSDTVESAQAESQDATQDSEQQKTDNALAMHFKDDCWIQVKDSSGSVLATGLKKAGESLTLTGKAPYSIILGAPEGVSISLAEEPVDLSKYTPGKVARLTLP